MAQEMLPGRRSAGPATAAAPESGAPDDPDTPDDRGKARAGRVRALAAVASGLLLWTVFPPINATPLLFVAVAALTLVLYGRSARSGAWLGLVAGVAFFVPVLAGLVKIGWDAWMLLAGVQALYFAPMGAGIALVTRLRWWPVPVAALWVAQELVRGRVPFGGFPWARLAFGQTDTPLTGYAALGGAPLVTFVAALVGTLGAYAALTVHRSRRAASAANRATERAKPAEPAKPAEAAELTDAAAPDGPDGPDGGRGRAGGVRSWLPGRPLVLVAAALAVIFGGGLLVPTPTGGDPVTVAVIQGNVPRLGLDFQGQRRAVLDNHVARTRELAAMVRAGTVPRPELVVWPENASDLDPYTEPEAYNAIDGAVQEIGVPVLVGALTDTPDGSQVENRGIVWDPRTGPGDYYVKRHPVPFGEYLPFRDILTKLITRFERIPRDFARGTRSPVLGLGPTTVGDVICFEVAYDGEVRDAAAGQMIVVQTNNATYGRTSLPPQQIAMSRLRAVEHGRTILVAATSGVSAIVAPDGRMLDRSGEFVPDIQVETVPARTSVTLATRVGAVPEWVLAVLAAAAVAAAVRGTRGAGRARARNEES